MQNYSMLSDDFACVCVCVCVCVFFFFFLKKYHPVFFPLVCSSFSRNNRQKILHFPVASSGDLLLYKRQKKSKFCFTEQ